MKQVYAIHEAEKKRSYNERVLQVEHASFSPIVMTTTGGSGPEAKRHHQRLASLIAEKRKEDFSSAMNHIRTRLRFSILRSTMNALGGSRGRPRIREEDLSTVDFNCVQLVDD